MRASPRSDFFLLTAAVTVLTLGILVYLFDRSASEIYFLPDSWSTADGMPDLFGWLGRHLPTFTHVYAFILISAVVLDVRARGALVITLIWLTVDAVFEISQIDAIALRIAEYIPDWFAGVPILENATGYFVNGDFDPFDLISIVLGGLAAFATLHRAYRWRNS